MNFVFSKYFFILLSCGFIALSLSWNISLVRWIVLGFDLFLILLALIDYRISSLPERVTIRREFNKRFAIGDEAEVNLKIENNSSRSLRIILKDEYPTQMKLTGGRQEFAYIPSQTTANFFYGLTPMNRGHFEFGKTIVRHLSTLGLVWVQSEIRTEIAVKVYPNMRRAREIELAALGAKSLVAVNRRAILRGEGRDFESLRDYVRGDELRHLSWTATARRGKLVTRQYQIERDQTVIIALDAGRLMTGRIENETKLDTAIQAALALMSAAARGGDNVGILVFGRRIKKFLPPKKGTEQFEGVLEALHDVEPEMVEPSYPRAFQFISANVKRRSFVVVLTDLVDEEGSKELLTSLKLLRPRHLPLVVTIGDRDLRMVVQDEPNSARSLFTQSVAEEILFQRETALKNVETQGGLALDVTRRTLAPSLLETYLRVKERGLL
jgi:uncharacterized protein (DUF58 family)